MSHEEEMKAVKEDVKGEGATPVGSPMAAVAAEAWSQSGSGIELKAKELNNLPKISLDESGSGSGSGSGPIKHVKELDSDKVILGEKLKLDDKALLGEKLKLDDKVLLGEKKIHWGESNGLVEFNKQGQEKVDLKGFHYTQNNDGSIVTQANGNTFVVDRDNNLTVVRANGQVETYKPNPIMFKDGGSVSMGYPPEAGFDLVRKNRIAERGNDTGVEITVPGHSFSTTMVPGRAGSFTHQDTGKLLWEKKKS